MESVLRNISWLGHDAYRIRAGEAIIYIDPFRLASAPVAADLILVSHDHYDHCSLADLEQIVKSGTVIVTEAQAAAKLAGDVRVVRPGDKVEVRGVTIEAVPAYNTNKAFHPAANGWLGFIITVEGVRIYHAGDTDYIPEMRHFAADIALLPVSGTYVMTAEEAAQAALDLKPRIAIPMHYGTLGGTRADALRFARLLAGKVRVEVLEAIT